MTFEIGQRVKIIVPKIFTVNSGYPLTGVTGVICGTRYNLGEPHNEFIIHADDNKYNSYRKVPGSDHRNFVIADTAIGRYFDKNEIIFSEIIIDDDGNII